MYKRFLSYTLIAVGALALLTTGVFATVTIETVTVGDINNPADDVYFNPGSVSYEYQIGKYEVTVGQYLEFLNAKASINNDLELYGAAMGNTGGMTPCGIVQNEVYDPQDPFGDPIFEYTAAETYLDRPIAWATFFNAVRFANWMHNGQSDGDTETGSYTIPTDWASGAGTHNSFGRNAGATWVVASNDEWHKAAYYNSSNQTYWEYATQTMDDNRPMNIFDGDTNRANVFDGETSRVTQPVGSYTNAVSPYGTFDQTGNVQEWTDSSDWEDGRIFRKGPCNWWQQNSKSDQMGQFWPMSTGNESNGFGFRLVSLDGYVPPQVPGDATGDGVVDDADATRMAEHWGATEQALGLSWWEMGDFNDDEAVDMKDASIMAANWGASGEAAAVPEPATAILLLAGFAMMVAARRR